MMKNKLIDNKPSNLNLIKRAKLKEERIAKLYSIDVTSNNRLQKKNAEKHLSIQINNNCSNSNISINTVSPTNDNGREQTANLTELDSKITLDQAMKTEQNPATTHEELPKIESFELPTVSIVKYLRIHNTFILDQTYGQERNTNRRPSRRHG